MGCRTDMQIVYMAKFQLSTKFVIVLLATITVVAATSEERSGCAECVNGHCEIDECICDPCWTGPKCDQYQNLHKPSFVQRHSKVYLTREHLVRQQSIFTAKVVDKDAALCEHSKLCACANVTYDLAQPNDLFAIDATSGLIRAIEPTKLQNQTEYILTVRAFSLSPSGAKAAQFEKSFADELQLSIIVQDVLGRVKRQAAARKKPKTTPEVAAKSVESFATSFSLRTVSGEVNSLQVGSSINYRLEIALPRASLDLLLEIHSRDSHTGNKSSPALSLYNFTVPHRASGISFSTPEPIYSLSNKSRNVFDKLSVDFGTIKNSGPDRNLLTIYFSVVLTRKPGKSETKHAVTIGAEYGKGTFIWVAQSQITTAALSQSDDQVHANVEFVSSPLRIPLDSAALFQMAANLEFRSDQLRVEISKAAFEYEPDNMLSLGRVSVSKFGKHYLAIPNNSSHYDSYRERTLSRAFNKSTLDMGVVTNIGEKGRSFSNNMDNVLNFEFTVYALNFLENVDKNVTFTVRIYLGSKVAWSKAMNVSIGERRQERSTAKMLISSGIMSAHNASKGGLAQLIIKSEFAEADAFVDFSLLVEVPASHRTALFVPCAARYMNEHTGFNIPYLDDKSIKPSEDGNQFTFTFDRIHFVNQRKASTSQDNTVVVEITLRVPFHQDIEDGTTLYANVKAFSGSKQMKVLIPNNELSVYSENKTGQIELTTNRSVPWEDLIIGGGVGLNIEMQLDPNTAFQQVQLIVQRDSQQNNLPELNVCKVSLVKVGMDLPCTCVQKDSINQNNTKYEHVDSSSNSTYHDKASIQFGSLSVVNSESDGAKKKLLANVALMIKNNKFEHEIYPIMVGLVADSEMVWSEKINFTIGQSTSQSEAIRNMSAKLELKALDRSNITPGFTTNALLQVITTPNTMGPLTVQVNSDDEELSVCGLWVDFIGDNMPCINKEAKANYDSLVYGQNNMAKLPFDTITNFGSAVRRSETEEQRANTLQFITMVRVSEAAKSNKTLKVTLTHGHKNVKLEQELVIPVNVSNKPLTEFKKPKHFAIKAADGSNVTYAGIGKLVYFDIELEPNSQVPITIMMESSNHFKVCSAAFVKIGKNYPCYASSSLKVSHGTFELGMLCNTFLFKDDPEDNLLRLAVALRPNGNLPEKSYKVSSLAYVGSTPLNAKHELLMTAGSGNFSTHKESVTKGATVHAEVADSVPIKIRERKWVSFSVRIPPFSTSQLSLHLQGDADETRAMLVLQDLRIVSGGSNIACPLENANFKFNLSSSVGTTQTNVIKANLGYFSNFGFSHSLTKSATDETDKLQDDLLKLQVLAQLTDHPAISEDDVFKIGITTNFGDGTNALTRQGQVKLVPVLHGEAATPKIEANIKIKKRQEVLDRGDTLTMTASLRHLPESSAEPINPVLRLFTPDFIEVIRIDSANTNQLPVLLNNTQGTTDILFEWILFSDEILVNFTVQIDPKNIRGYGREEISLVTPYRVMCEHYRAESNFKTPCSQVKHLNLLTKSSECHLPLGMESGQIEDWQITASTAISKDFAPTNARPKSSKYWSPIIRKGRNDYLQIDFGRKTRVVSLSYKSIRGLRRVSSFHLLYSEDGRIWRTAANKSRFNFNGEQGESTVKSPVEARLYRFVIDEIEASSKGKNQYVAIRLELFGCYLEEQLIKPNSTEFVTHFSDDPTAINRHIAVDKYTNVLYFCDTTLENHQLCYHSSNGGQSWTIIGRSIDSVEGFELATGKFFAIDYQRPAYFCSSNGVDWTPIDWDLFNSTVNHSKFQPKMVVPQFHRDDLRKMDIHFGKWRANYDGLYYEDSQTPKAMWKNCCSE